MVKERNIVLCVIFSIITCGIYGIYWFIVMTNETNAVAPNSATASGGKAFLFTLLTLGIYGIYWAYKLGEKLDEANSKRGLPAKNQGILFLILNLLGFGIITYIIAQSELNKIAING